MQVREENGGEKPCPLCNIPEKEVLVEVRKWKLARTKNMKGHKERLMLYHKDHVKTLDEQSVGEAHMLLMLLGQKFFSYSTQWAIFEPVFATVPGHWHRVASDLDPSSEDYEQILTTPRLIIDADQMTISRVNPASPDRLPEIPPSTDPQEAQLVAPGQLLKTPESPNVKWSDDNR